MYVVWADGVEQSIPFEDIADAKEFAHESNMNFEVRDTYSGSVVYRAADYEYSIYYKE